MTYQDYLRFERRVQRTESCWVWTGNKAGYGYGYFCLNHTKRIKAHRAAWQFSNGQVVPLHKWILHRCNVRLCVNPNHLYVGTVLDNNRDTVKAGTHPFTDQEWKAQYGAKPALYCRRGHLMDENNRYLDKKRAKKRCAICQRTADRRRYREHRQQPGFWQGNDWKLREQQTQKSLKGGGE